MDTISVSMDGLKNAFLALQEFREQTANVTKTCTTTLQNNEALIDETFLNDLRRFSELLQDWNQRVDHYVTENQSAIQERAVVMEQYTSCTYKKNTY